MDSEEGTEGGGGGWHWNWGRTRRTGLVVEEDGIWRRTGPEVEILACHLWEIRCVLEDVNCDVLARIKTGLLNELMGTTRRADNVESSGDTDQKDQKRRKRRCSFGGSYLLILLHSCCNLFLRSATFLEFIAVTLANSRLSGDASSTCAGF
jgi:hypothetical protein